jgi:hypothetical protein
MIHGKHISRHRPDSLALLSLFVSLAAVVTTALGGNAGGDPVGSDSIDFKDLAAETQRAQRKKPLML